MERKCADYFTQLVLNPETAQPATTFIGELLGNLRESEPVTQALVESAKRLNDLNRNREQHLDNSQVLEAKEAEAARRERAGQAPIPRPPQCDLSINLGSQLHHAYHPHEQLWYT